MANLYYIDDNGQAHYIPVRAGVDSVNGQTGAVEIPIATVSNPGLVKVHTASAPANNFGIYALDGMLRLSSASAAMIDDKADYSHAITPVFIDHAVRSGLISNTQITDADKPLICETIGAVGIGKWETIDEFTLTSDGTDKVSFFINKEPNGTPYNFRRVRVAMRFDENTVLTDYCQIICYKTDYDGGSQQAVARCECGNQSAKNYKTCTELTYDMDAAYPVTACYIASIGSPSSAMYKSQNGELSGILGKVREPVKAIKFVSLASGSCIVRIEAVRM